MWPGCVSPMLCPCRVLEALWELLLQAILQALGGNSDVSADFYGRFHFTLEVGHAELKGPVLSFAPSLPTISSRTEQAPLPSHSPNTPGPLGLTLLRAHSWDLMHLVVRSGLLWLPRPTAAPAQLPDIFFLFPCPRLWLVFSMLRARDCPWRASRMEATR